MNLPGIRDGGLRDGSLLREGPLARALTALNGEGEETRVVGGAVRDLVLGLAPADVDLATTALPDETMRRAAAAGFKVAPTGIDHGAVTLIMDGRTIEATTLREDVETDGRHARVAFGRDFAADARRRDFTINALFLDAGGWIFDPVGGLDDLAAGRVRFIGDPDARIREDYLRILRFFRFSARFAVGALDREGLDATVRRREGLAKLSRERVRAEVLKILVAPRSAEIVRIMSDFGVLGDILGFAAPGRLARAIEVERGRGPDALLRLAALALLVPEDGERLVRRLRLSNAEGERLTGAASALVRLHGISAAPPDALLRRLTFELGRTAASDGLALAEVDSGSPPGAENFALARRALVGTPAPISPVGGKDILALGVAPGPRVGKILETFHRLWGEAGCPSEAPTIERFVRIAIEDAPMAPGDGQ